MTQVDQVELGEIASSLATEIVGVAPDASPVVRGPEESLHALQSRRRALARRDRVEELLRRAFGVVAERRGGGDGVDGGGDALDPCLLPRRRASHLDAGWTCCGHQHVDRSCGYVDGGGEQAQTCVCDEPSRPTRGVVTFGPIVVELAEPDAFGRTSARVAVVREDQGREGLDEPFAVVQEPGGAWVFAVGGHAEAAYRASHRATYLAALRAAGLPSVADRLTDAADPMPLSFAVKLVSEAVFAAATWTEPTDGRRAAPVLAAVDEDALRAVCELYLHRLDGR